MEIKFNPSQPTGSAARQPIAQNQAATTAADSSSLSNTKLMSAIGNIPIVREDKVNAARTSISDPNFPSIDMLSKVASLLAEKMQ